MNPIRRKVVVLNLPPYSFMSIFQLHLLFLFFFSHTCSSSIVLLPTLSTSCATVIVTLSFAFTLLFHFFSQIPDDKKGDERIDAVIVDEELTGSEASRGCTAKILKGDRAFERYLSENKSQDATEATVPHELSLHLEEFVRIKTGLQTVVQAGLLKEGLCSVQDESAGLIVSVVKPQPGERIMDACAAPGGKTLFMASCLKGQGIMKWCVPKDQANLCTYLQDAMVCPLQVIIMN